MNAIWQALSDAHKMKPATAEIFKSQLKSMLPEVEMFINLTRPNAAVRRTPY
jgi:hypothetical protein